MKKHNIRIGRVFCICVETGAELPANDPVQTPCCTPRQACRWPNVGVGYVPRQWVIFQDIGTNPASMHAGEVVDPYACCPAHCCQQSDADQAYAQAWLKQLETWNALPRDAWRPAWLNKDGTPRYDKPVLILLRYLYDHPDAGTFW